MKQNLYFWLLKLNADPELAEQFKKAATKHISTNLFLRIVASCQKSLIFGHVTSEMLQVFQV